MLDGTGRSEPGNIIDSYNLTVSYRARKHRSACWYPKKPERRPNASRIASGLISAFFPWRPECRFQLIKAQTKSFAGQSFSRKYAKELLQGVVASRPFGRRRHFRTLLLREFQLCSAKTAALSEQPTRKVFFEVMAGKSVVTEAIYSLAANASVSFKRSIKSHVGGYGQRCPFMVQATDSCTINRRSLG